MAMNIMEQFKSDCTIRNISSSPTYISYTQEFTNFLKERGKEPADVTKEDLTTYLANLRGRGLKQTSINRIFTCLSSLYAFLVDEDLTSSNPVIPFRRRYLRKYKDDNSSDSRKIIEIENHGCNDHLDPDSWHGCHSNMTYLLHTRLTKA